MYLKELRIQGFKSFADPTQLALRQGVIAIVGPNGCGKSNIADAIRWVLGEQSSKSLRAGAMQDVIFQGTTHRKPLGFCEVSLLFTDCEAQLGTAFKEVEISRRVTRDGGSEYSINGKSARLKDIQRLFLDTGVGQVSYSFMLQGQIDQVLSSNPSERRAIFEEAAGISRYKAQRREALNKLEGVEANLARVSDVMEEVGRRIGTLRRQASKAIRYKRFQHRLTHLSLASAARRFQELKRAANETVAVVEGQRTKTLQLRGKVEDAEHRLAQLRSERTAHNERLQQAQQSVYELRSARDQANSKADTAGLRRKDHEERMAALEKDLEALDHEKNSLQGRAEGERKAREEQMELFGSSGSEFERMQSELNEVQQQLAEAERGLGQARQTLMMREGGVTRLRSNCTTLEVDLKTFEGRHSALADEIRQAEAELEGLRAQQAELEAENEIRLDRKESEEAQLAEARAEVERRLGLFREQQQQIQQTDRELATLLARVGMLEDLQRKMEGFSEGSKAILKGKLAEAVPTERCTLVMSQLDVDENWASVAELLLAAAVDAIALEAREDLLPLLKGLEGRRLGRACLMLPADGRALATDKAPEGILSALDVVKAKSPEFEGQVASLFGGCYFAEDAETVLQVVAENPDWGFQSIATRDGCVFDQRGLVFGGQGSAPKDSFLRRDAQIRQLAAQRDEMEGRLETLREAGVEAQQNLRQAEEDVESLRKRLNETTQELAALQAQRKGAEDRVRQGEKRLEGRQQDLGKLDQSRAESLQRLQKAQQELEATEADIAAKREALAEAEQRVEQLRGEREARREGFETLRMDVAEKKQRLELLQRGLEELDRRVRELSSLRQRREGEIAAIREQLAGLEGEAERERAIAAKMEAELQEAHKVLEARRDSLVSCDRQVEALEKEVTQARAELDERSGELNKAELKLQKQRSELEYISTEARKEHNRDVENLDWRHAIWHAGEPVQERIKVDLDDEEPLESPTDNIPDPTSEDLQRVARDVDWKDVDAEIQTLRGRIDSMGPVNLVAIEEYKELRERHDFLKAQSDDLWQAKDQLVKAIDDINQTSATLFRDTFKQIRENFRYTFETLFGGGEADLQLIEGEDVLEAGIEIVARPPGTKLRSIGLLSGGQKTMTAVGLLFAIYMVKPSPFCVLDEIDAPLDDANIGRFCKMLERFLEFSQFLIITHNKRTISAANTIYGVTMQERGVSRVLSMAFNKAEGKLETTAPAEVS